MDEEKKMKLFKYLDDAGIDKEEYEKKFNDEYIRSQGLNMDDESAFKRALIATTNYYRKYLDKLGNRVLFMAFGITKPTDYGLSRKVEDVRKAWNAALFDENKKNELIASGAVDSVGRPLHTSDTTRFTEKIGKIINLDDEMSQMMIGIVKNKDGTMYPTIVRINGRKACNENKILYQWTYISGEQGNSQKYPGYIILNSYELNMKAIDDKRISYDEYMEYIKKYFSKEIFDAATQEPDTISDDRFSFIINARMLEYDFFNNTVRTHIVSAPDIFESFDSPILFDAVIPQTYNINVDPNDPGDIILLVQPYKQVIGKRRKVEILGMFNEHPIDYSVFSAEEDSDIFVSGDIQESGKSNSADEFFS